jgi:hypothetical protein
MKVSMDGKTVYSHVQLERGDLAKFVKAGYSASVLNPTYYKKKSHLNAVLITNNDGMCHSKFRKCR